jgi:hypothetical protein
VGEKRELSPEFESMSLDDPRRLRQHLLDRYPELARATLVE